LFTAQLEAAARGDLPCRLIALDIPGFGESPAPERMPAAYTVEALADLVEAFVTTLGLVRPLIGGVAIGGSVAIEVAQRDPGAAAALVLIANRPTSDAPSKAADREAAATRVLESGSVAVAASLADAALGPRASVPVRRRVRSMISDADPRAVAALVRAIAMRPDPTPALPTLTIPALVIAGADDPMGSPVDVERLARLLPDGRFVLIPGAGHLVPIERPAAVTQALAAFLRARESP
jgi:3-oxoadipate enol-lactonase/4-carboxymuconolactone decarboxylase